MFTSEVSLKTGNVFGYTFFVLQLAYEMSGDCSELRLLGSCCSQLSHLTGVKHTVDT